MTTPSYLEEYRKYYELVLENTGIDAINPAVIQEEFQRKQQELEEDWKNLTYGDYARILTQKHLEDLSEEGRNFCDKWSEAVTRALEKITPEQQQFYEKAFQFPNTLKMTMREIHELDFESDEEEKTFLERALDYTKEFLRKLKIKLI